MKTQIELTSLDWKLARHPERGTEPDWSDVVPARVPGCVLDDMVRAGLAPDPFYGENFRACAWTGEWTFWYGAEFSFESLGIEAAAREIRLRFDAIDTYAEVFVNGHSVGRPANQFVRHVYSIAPLLKADGVNRIEVRIDPVKAVFKEWQARHQPDGSGVVSVFDNDRPWIRKAQMTFGWDNCPYLVAGGITLPVCLEVVSGPELDAIEWRVPAIDLEAGHARLEVRGAIRGLKDAPAARIRIEGNCDGHLLSGEAIPSEDGRWTAKIEVGEACFWWPNGLGEPHLYDVSIACEDESGTLDRAKLRIGLRTIEVVTGPAESRPVDYRIGPNEEQSDSDMDGSCLGPWERLPLDETETVEVRPFYFKVNGRRIFAKGFDWQAPDVLVGRIRDGQIRKIIDGVRQTGANMVRAWGGGAIERNAFYEACDENGLLLWQDFFFACAVYPRDPLFLGEIRREAPDIVQRLRHHTCLAAWCGDNESDMIEYDRGRDPSLNPYNKKILPEAVRTHDWQNRYYHPSSPSGGPYPRSDFGGDKRNWGPSFPQNNYWHIRQEDARFISESGSKSLPSLETVEKYFPEGLRWPILNRTWRLHAGDQDHEIRGDYWMEPACTEHFHTAQGLEEAVAVSQFAQAWGAKLLAEQCRRRKGECGGILYWKTSDQWPCYDQGLYDSGGHLRPVHQWLTQTFRPLAVSLTQDWRGGPKADLELWLVNDRDDDVCGSFQIHYLKINEDGKVEAAECLGRGSASVGTENACLAACVAFPPGADPEASVFVASFDANGSAEPAVRSTYTANPRAAYRFHLKGKQAFEPESAALLR